MKRKETTTSMPDVAQLAMSMAMSGKSWDEFADTVADKIAARFQGVFPTEEHTSTIREEKPLRGVRELCRFYGISSATVNKLLKQGKIPFRQIGNRYLFYCSEVDAALKGGAAI